jgi:hypothetical protein
MEGEQPNGRHAAIVTDEAVVERAKRGDGDGDGRPRLGLSAV